MFIFSTFLKVNFYLPLVYLLYQLYCEELFFLILTLTSSLLYTTKSTKWFVNHEVLKRFWFTWWLLWCKCQSPDSSQYNWQCITTTLFGNCQQLWHFDKTSIKGKWIGYNVANSELQPVFLWKILTSVRSLF